MSNDPSASITVVYDGECPFCSRYVRMLRLRKAFGTVRLIDARSAEPMAQEAAQRFDLDAGMAADVNGQWYHGADCMNVLALASGPSPVVNRMMAFIFADPIRARRLYPVLRTGRNLTLRLLGKGPIGRRGNSGGSLSRP